MLSEMFFLHPWRVVFMVLIPVMIYLLTRLFAYRKKVLNNFADPSQHPYLVVGASSSLRLWRYFLILFSVAMALLVLMEPVGNVHYPSSLLKQEAETIKAIETKKWHEVMLLIDTSQSMAVKDTRPGISRLELAKEIAQSIVVDLEGKTVSLAAFTSVETPLVPATQDILFTLLVLRHLKLNEGDTTGTDLVDALKGIREHFKEDPIQKVKTVVLFTDGGDTSLENKGRTDEILNALGDPFAMNLRLIVVAMGSVRGGVIPAVTFQGQEVKSAVELPLLKKIAARGRGEVVTTEGKSTQSISTSVRALIDKEASPEEVQEVVRHARGALPDPIHSIYFRFPLALSIIALILFLWLPEARFMTIFFVFVSVPCWGNVQDPLIYLEAGQGVKAEQIYHEMLIDDRNPWHQAVANYNLGCFSMQRGDYDAALGYFDAVTSIKNISPLLTSYVYLNSSIATALLVEKMVKDKEINPAQGLIMLRDAEKQLILGYQADCSIGRLEGSGVCPEIASYKQVGAYLQRLAANLRREEEHRRRLKEADESSLSPMQIHLQKSLDETLSMISRQEIDPRNIEDLLNELNDLKSLFPDQNVKEAIHNGISAQKSLKANKNEQTRFFLLSLYQWLELILAKNNNKEPKSALRAAIEQEMNAIDMTIDMKKIGEEDGSLKEVLLQKQELVRAAGISFVDVVIIEQKKEFKKGYCQKEPWHSALPLYFEGYKMALAAAQELNKGTLVNAIHYQNETLDYWKLALKALETPPSETKASNSLLEKKEIQNLIEMETEDIPQKPQSPPKVVDKPW